MNAIDLFAGAGGLSIALRDCGFNIVLANEINHRYAETHRLNFPEVNLIEKDINEISGEELLSGTEGHEIDLIVGGPPCQGFSVFGKRRFVNTQEYDPHKDPRNFLVYQFMRVVETLKPKFFLMENVKGFTNLDKGLFVESVKSSFKKLGYKDIWCEIVCAADYGVPQERYRETLIYSDITSKGR